MSEETQQEPERPSITLHDIAAVVQILDVCTARSVWKPAELSSVGRIYDRLSAFLEGAGYTTESAAETPKETE